MKKYLAYQSDGQYTIQRKFEAIDNAAASAKVGVMIEKEVFRYGEQVDTFVFSEAGGNWEWVSTTVHSICES